MVLHKQEKSKVLFSKWNVRSLYRSSSFTATARKESRYKLDLVGVQEVRWEKRGTAKAGNCFFFCGKGKEIIGNSFFCTPQNIMSSE